MPRLVLTFGQFLEILLSNGFELHRKGATSHRRYRGIVSGRVQMVDLAAHNMNDEIRPGTLQSMIRQSGLPKSAFRR